MRTRRQAQRDTALALGAQAQLLISRGWRMADIIIELPLKPTSLYRAMKAVEELGELERSQLTYWCKRCKREHGTDCPKLIDPLLL